MGNQINICKGSMVVIKDSKKDGLYHLVGETMTRNIAMAKAPEDQKALLWHRRLRHISNKSLLIIHQ